MFRALLGAVTLIAGLALHSVAAEVLVLGSVNDNVRKHVKRFTPLAEYLERELADAGITKVQIMVHPTSDAMAEALASGEVDLYFDSPLVAANTARKSESIPFLRRWKRGVASYHSLIVVPTDSDIHSIEDLVGQSIGFQDPDSTSGYLLPIGLILRENLPVREISSYKSDKAEDAISYVFTKDDKNTVLWLSRRWIDAAATDPNGFSKLEEAFPGEYRPIARSIDVPRQTVIRSGRMDPELAKQIQTVLVSMGDLPEGKEVLKKFHKTTRFDVFPDGIEETFAPIYDLLDALEAKGVLGS